MSFFCSSLVLFLQYTSNYKEMFSITRWLMGSLDIMGINTALSVLVLSLGVLILILKVSKELDIISVDDEFAITKGVDVKRVNNLLLISTSALVAVIVSLCGVIGFVGIMVPHISRSVVSRQHFYLVLSSFLLGGALLCASDAFSRAVIAPNELPVGIITSLLGAPFFIILLLKRKFSN